MFAELSRRIKAKVAPGIGFHRAHWKSSDAAGIEELANRSETLRAQFKSYVRSYLRLEASDNIALVGSGRTALGLGLGVLSRLRPTKRKVVVPSYCCTAIVSPIVDNGLVPHFIDTGADLISDARQYSEAMTEDVLAVVTVNLCGKRTDTETRANILNRGRSLGIFSIEDNCHYFQPMATNQRPDMELHSFGFGKVLAATAGGALISRVGQTEIDAKMSSYQFEPRGAARARFDYFSAKYGGASVSSDIQAEFERSRTQYGLVQMSDFDIALALAGTQKLTERIQQQLHISKRLQNTLRRQPHTYKTPSAADNSFTRLPVILPDTESFSRFWSFMAAREIELEGMYLPLHLKFPELHDGRGLPHAENVYSRVFNIPNRHNLGILEVARIQRALSKFPTAT